MGVMPWSPLAGGFLTDKYQRRDVTNTGRLSGANPFGQSKFVDRNWLILEALRDVAAEVDRPMAQVALRWVMQRPGVTSTLIGVRSMNQLADNLAATTFELGKAQMASLDAASAPLPGFSAGLTSPAIRRMIFGGNDVSGWLE